MNLISSSRLSRHLSLITLIVLGTLLLRLIFVLVLDPHPKLVGGDTNWYMEVGDDLVTTGTTKGPIQTPPLYPLLLGAVQSLTPSTGSQYSYTDVQTVRLIQSVLWAAICWFVYIIANRFFSRRVGLWAAGLIAISPVFVIEAGNVVSESLFFFWLYAALALYSRSLDQLRPRYLLGVGALLALATLTRAVSLVLPVVIIAHLFFHVRQQKLARQRWLRLSACLLLSYVPLISTWTVYNFFEWDRVVIGGEGFLSFLYQGAEGQASPQELDQQLNVTAGEPGEDVQTRNAAMKREVETSILDNPVGWVDYRVKELASAYLQPHNTTYFGGRSIKDATSSWLRTDRSLGGLRDVVKIQGFVPKLLLYLFHYGVLLLGTAGMILFARRWRVLLVLYGLVFYFTGIHLALLALPRYLFPIMPIWYLFACAFVVWWWDKRQRATIE